MSSSLQEASVDESNVDLEEEYLSTNLIHSRNVNPSDVRNEVLTP